MSTRDLGSHVIEQCRLRLLPDANTVERTNEAGRVYLSAGGFVPGETTREWLDALKQQVKRFAPRLVPSLVAAVTPVLVRRFVQPYLRTFNLDRDFVIDVGAGAMTHDPRICCIDGYPYHSVHLVADVESLPLRDATVDGVLSVAMLEHVRDPRRAVSQMWRVLKPGGRVLCAVPFMQGFHASPHDYQRYTDPGLRELFSQFVDHRVVVGAGPTSALVWLLQEWLAMVLSFGVESLYRAILPLTYVLSPLKWLDLLLARHPAASHTASLLVIEARKPG